MSNLDTRFSVKNLVRLINYSESFEVAGGMDRAWSITSAKFLPCAKKLGVQAFRVYTGDAEIS